MISGQARSRCSPAHVLPGTPAVRGCRASRETRKPSRSSRSNSAPCHSSSSTRRSRAASARGRRTARRSPCRRGARSGSAETPNAARTCRGRAHYAVRAASDATISASTVVSAGIASSRACARSAASSAAGVPPRPRARPRSRPRRAGRRRSGTAARARRRTRARPAARASGTSATQSATPTEAEKSAPVFSRCSAARSAVSPVTSRYWPPIIAERRLRELAADQRRRVGQREPERLREQRVAGEQRGRLAERDVRGRAAAALVVVVERRQVVVDERERVHELDRCRRRQHVLGGGARRLADRERDHGADALAARLERIAERLLEAAELRRERQLAEVPLDERAQLVRAAEHPRGP